MPIRVVSPSIAERHASPDADTKSKKGLRTLLSFYPSPTASPVPANAKGPNPEPTAHARSPNSVQSPTEDKYSTVKEKERRSVDVARSENGSYFVSLSYRRKKARTREGRASVTDVAFFQHRTPPHSPTSPTPTPAPAPSTPVHKPIATLETPDITTVDLASPDRKPKMTKALEMPQERASRRKMARIEAQDGPWSVSVAESPYDKNSYSIYIKTPTHHMTLTRSGQEIQELHRKIASAHPELALPEVPLQALDENADNALTEKKRKSSFLHTLSRFASPGPNKRERPRDTKVAHSSMPSSRNSIASNGNVAGMGSTPPVAHSHSTSTSMPSKDTENWDPFMSSLATPTDTNSATSTALAGYLTTLANEPALKTSKAWRRFVRIRTDDLISERVERAVKRVRSDLAAHLAGARARRVEIRDDISVSESAVMVDLEREDGEEESGKGQSQSQSGGAIEKIKEEEEGEDASTAENVGTRKSDDGEGAAAIELPETPKPSDVASRSSLEIPGESVSTPTTETHATIASRIPRSQSADPDKATRMSRIFHSSPIIHDGDESAAEYETDAQVETEVEEAKSTTTMEDDSSVSTSGFNRKSKRSKSVPPKEKSRKLKTAKKVVVDDFEMMRVLGKGCAGKVLLVRHKKSESLYALKAITKRHVLAHQELQHTLTEQAVLKRMAREAKDPFVVKLWWSFHDKENLFLVMDFHPGGDLATQLARWGRLGRDRARFYAAEIVEGVDGLHAAGVIYRDLKPENILIGADGHIVLTDFGLSKEFPRRTSPITAPATPSGSRSDFHAQQPVPHWMKGEENGAGAAGAPAWPIGQNDTTSTFCGTAEYLAPEVIQGQAYSYEVDWWSFGTMLYEMLTGITPFWANNHSEMYVRVLQDELKFPDDRVMDQDTKSLIRGLLQRNPALRIKQPRIKRHPYFSMIDWSHVYYKRYIPPYIPPIDPLNASDTQNFDDTFLDMEPVIADENEQAESDADNGEASEKTDGEDNGARTPAQSRSPSVHPQVEDEADLFDGYSFKGRHSMLIEDDDDEHAEGDEDVDEIDEEEDIQRLANADVGQAVEDEAQTADGTETEAEEPKTPEARKSGLPELTPAEEIAALHKAALAAAEASEPSTPVREMSAQAPSIEEEKTPEGIAAQTEEKEGAPQTPLTPQAAPRPRPSISESVAKATPTAPPASKVVVAARSGRTRREKSGIPALDRYLSDGGDDEMTERDEDDDWDFVEALPVGAEDRNGAKGTSLFARGVVDRYKLSVFRKSATPSKGTTQRRNVSGMSLASESTTVDVPSPTPAEKRRGRNPGLTFRRNPKQFLKTRSPPPSASSNGSSRTHVKRQSSATALSSTASSTGNLLSPAPSTHPSTIAGPSLRSKDSTTSMGSPASSDDQSLNGDIQNSCVSVDALGSGATSPDTSKRNVTIDEPEKQKGKKLKKYKENAEKMLSIFASPR